MQRQYVFTILKQVPSLPEDKAQVIPQPDGPGWILKGAVPVPIPAGGTGMMFIWTQGESDEGSDSLSQFFNTGR